MTSTAQSQLIPILLYLGAGVLGAFGQYFYKIGGQRLGKIPLLINWPLFLGLIAFCLVMVCFVAGFKMGGRLSVVYPFYATTFIWATAIAYYWDHEPVSLTMIAGILAICFGVALIARGS